MKRKGISPLIAAVLLIAFTMAVASIFAQWAPQLVQNTQEEASEDAVEIQDCSQYLVELNAGNNTHATVTQTSGPNPIGNVTVTWRFDSAAPGQTVANLSASNRDSTQVNHTSAGDSDYDNVTIDEIEANPDNCQGAATDTFPPN